MSTINEADRQYQENRERHRAESGVTEPQYAEFPRWLKNRVNALGLSPYQPIGFHRYGCHSGWEACEALQRAIGDGLGSCHVFDHHGRLRGPDGEWLLVSEPYADVDDPRLIAAVQAVADMLLLDYAIGPNSWWNPPSTIRLTWWPTTGLTEHKAREQLRRRGKEQERLEREARAELWRQEVEQTAQGGRR